MSELGNLRAAFVNLWGRMGPLWGIPPTAARVYGWLIASDEAADAETISGALELSRGGVSMALKELRDWGLIVVTRAPFEHVAQATLEAVPVLVAASAWNVCPRHTVMGRVHVTPFAGHEATPSVPCRAHDGLQSPVVEA